MQWDTTLTFVIIIITIIVTIDLLSSSIIYYRAYFPLHHLHHVQCWPAAHLHTFPGCTLGMGCICAFAHYEWAATAQLDRAANIISLYWHHHFAVCTPQDVQTHYSSLVVASYGKSYSVISYPMLTTKWKATSVDCYTGVIALCQLPTNWRFLNWSIVVVWSSSKRLITSWIKSKVNR